jgi:hypothetical protein
MDYPTYAARNDCEARFLRLPKSTYAGKGFHAIAAEETAEFSTYWSRRKRVERLVQDDLPEMQLFYLYLEMAQSAARRLSNGGLPSRLRRCGGSPRPASR